MRAILPLALLAVTACYTPRAVEPVSGPYEDPYAWGIEPLEASIYYDEFSGYATVDLSRPAHVAIFSLQPGAGMSMIYPAIGVARRTAFRDGRHLLRTGGMRYSVTGSRGSFMGRRSDAWSHLGPFGQGPTYILLVASDEPLAITPFHATRTMAWLNRSAVTYSPYVALDALVGEIVPRPQSSAWTTAMHVIWPLDAFPGPRDRRYLRVQCESGMTVVVPEAALFAGYPVCQEHLERPPSDSTKPDGITDVIPKRPKPPAGWMTAKVGDLDLERELARLREIHRKRDPGVLSIRPFPELPPRERRGDLGVARRGTSDDGVGTRRTTRPSAERSRPSSRPSAERSRPSSRPSARPARPAPRPVTRPAPTPASRPAPTRPAKPPKPKKPGGGGGSGGDPVV